MKKTLSAVFAGLAVLSSAGSDPYAYRDLVVTASSPAKVREGLLKEIEELKAQGHTPGLAVVLVGEDEVKEGVLSVKDMLSGEQKKLSPQLRKYFKRSKSLLTKRFDTLSDDQKQQVDQHEQSAAD